jgi:O-antigen ligase
MRAELVDDRLQIRLEVVVVAHLFAYYERARRFLIENGGRMRTSARRFVDQSRLAAPAAGVAALCFSTGGFFPGTVAVAAIVAIAAVVLRLTLAPRPWEGWSLGLSIGAGSLALFAVWTLVSAEWSDAPARALLEFDRALLYLAVLVLFGLFAARAGDLGALLRWTAAAIACVCVAAVLTRLDPGSFPTSRPPEHERLAFPLTYWNALGVLAAVGLVLLFHVTSSIRQPAVARVLAAAAFPAVAVTLYFTFSRGGSVAAIGGLAIYLVLGHSRAFLPALLAVAPTTAIALNRAYDAELLAGGQFDAPVAAAERSDVLTTLVICVAVAGVARAALLLGDVGLARIRLSRRRRFAGKAVAGLLVLALAGVAVASGVPDRIDQERRELLNSERQDLRGHLAEWGENNRADHWRVALDEYRARPLQGTGAGTYQRSWERERPGEANVVDAHSLYLEVLSELGWPGLVFLVVALVAPLALALPRLRGPERHAYAAFLAAGSALLLHAGIDWDWEMPALFLWFFAATGVVLARRAGGVAAAPARLTRILAGLACLALALTPVLIYRSTRALERSVTAFEAGDCVTAVDAALDSIDALPALAEPFEVLGYCDARAGRNDLAIRAMRSARARDRDGWEFAYGLAVTEALAGRDPAAAVAALRRANPLEPMAQDLVKRLRSRSPARRRRAAGRAPIPVDPTSDRR